MLASMRAILCACLLLLGLAGAAAADQKDPRLETLFEMLKASTSPREAATFEGEIWSLWLRHDSATVSLLMGRTLQAMNEGRLADSLEILDEMVVLAPDFAEAWNKRATVLYLMQRFEASLRDVEKTLALEPRHFGALSGKGLIYNALGDDAKALEAFEKTLEIVPHSEFAQSEVKRLTKKVRGEKI
jgi:tetratricopeptide (TPR) repeat protein